MSLPAARLLARTWVTPVQVTWVSAALAVGGAVAFGLEAYVLGAVLIFVGVITDCIDGDLARITGRSSKTGAFIDSVLDRWTDSAMILGLAYSDVEHYAGVAGVALVTSLLTSYTRARAQSLGVDSPEGLGGRDSRILILVVAALAGFVYAGLVIVAVLGLLTSVQRAVIAGRKLTRLDHGRVEEGASMDPHTWIERAMRIAREVHSGQKDKAGRPFIEHVQRVTHSVQDPWQKTVALLHDVLEHSKRDPADLRREGFPERVVEAVVALTKRDGEEYADFVRRAASNPLARDVKRADLQDNLRQARKARLDEAERRELIERYEGALSILKDDGVPEPA